MVLNQTETEITQEINHLLDKNIPLSSYVAPQVLKLLVENACTHSIPPAFSRSAVLFVNLLGLPEAADHVTSSTEENQVLTTLSHLFAQINSLVEAKDGFLQEWTYHLYSDILIYFGIPSGHIDDAIRAVKVACQISNLVRQIPLLQINNRTFQTTCQIGIDWGIVVAGEIGHSFGRRGYNALGDPVNRAAYIMSQADNNQILMTDAIAQEIACECRLLNIDLPFQLQLTEKMITKGGKKSISIFTIDALST